MIISEKLTQEELLKLLVDINLKAEANENLQVTEVIEEIVDRLKSYV
ncbi:hypothetical protein AJ85_00315 [Alkalihalobacillus alcalophilus ATCC 27647 = CGMCC 1.3604]|uniref:Uncharacterized protein n=1 Tax=Alkalihalobacillus alcalophilus ATCC 27647 = CGMCC 1.3604 TaxID=1218173 RepID=A0A4S4JWS1_ALKAL|nr:hypothetical protein [Alkalihalobacillus alcalophilus]MED1562451.1 hypothetical protein [Alkalihalobacillus alcalophilus]THG88727.1 hypothetical protein AJ85_00315 [Alkalihalobacillus alcalophilus ATCC 27647 = CGMCC 1.3604]